MEITRERLEREFTSTSSPPHLPWNTCTHDAGQVLSVHNPSELPPGNETDFIEEPLFKITILTPTDYTGTVMDLCQTSSWRNASHGIHFDRTRRTQLPHATGGSRGRFLRFPEKPHQWLRLAGLRAGWLRTQCAGENRRAAERCCCRRFSAITHKDKAYDYGKKMTARTARAHSRQMFDVPIQAAIGGRIIARETVKARRKDVLAKCYGGDISRKRKLLRSKKKARRR